MKNSLTAPTKFRGDDLPTRIAGKLFDAVKAVDSVSAFGDTYLAIARGIALRCQRAKMSPGTFDNPDGRDALIAIALSVSVRELRQLAMNNATMLNKRWGNVVYVMGLEMPCEAGSTNVAAIKRAAGMKDDTSSNQWMAPTMFERF